jgi:two-component system chemotaxis sensor kinase CheA
VGPRLSLPLPLAVSNVILVGSGGHTDTLPLERVRETVKVRPQEVKSLNGHHALSIRGRVVVLQSMSQRLGAGTGQATTGDATRWVVIIVISVGDAGTRRASTSTRWWWSCS